MKSENRIKKKNLHRKNYEKKQNSKNLELKHALLELENGKKNMQLNLQYNNSINYSVFFASP